MGAEAQVLHADHQAKVLMNCVFINFTHQEEARGKNLFLYREFAKYCPLSSLLFSAAMLLAKAGYYVSPAASNNESGLIYTHNMADKLAEMVGLKLSKPCNLAYVISFVGSSNAVSLARLDIIREMLATRFPSNSISRSDLEKTLFELKNYLTILQSSAGDSKIAMNAYTAINLLYSLKGSLSEKEMAECIENIFNRGITQLRVVYQTIATNITSDNGIVNDIFTRDISTLFEKAFGSFGYSVQLAYESPYEHNIQLLVVEKALKQMKFILNHKTLLPETKERLEPLYQTVEQWPATRASAIANMSTMGDSIDVATIAGLSNLDNDNPEKHTKNFRMKQ